MKKNVATFIFIALFLSACTGGGSTGSTTATSTPSQQSNQTSTPPAPTSLLTYLNSLRTLAGVTSYLGNTQLSNSATAHSNYQITNNVMGHGETASLAGFTGASAAERSKYAGYLSSSVSEDISFNHNTGVALVDELMTAVYHRMSLLDFDKNEIGLGLIINPNTNNGAVWSVLTTNSGLKPFNDACAAGGEVIVSGTYYICNDGISKISAASYNQWLSNLRGQGSDLVVWPPANAIVPPYFYKESPDPLPECSVSGDPVSVQVNPALNSQIVLDLASFVLKEKISGNAVALFRTLSNLSTQPDSLASTWQSTSKAWFAAFPTSRLNWGTTYQASINYTNAGTAMTKSWEFTTTSLSQKPIILTQNTTISAPGQSQFIIYVPPGDCTAGTTQVTSHSTGPSNPLVTIQSVDAQTFSIAASGATQAVLTFTQPGTAQTYVKTLTINF